jgi:RHS repeat-associated protein
MDVEVPFVAVPHADWRGRYDVVTFTGSRYAECGPHVGYPLGTQPECFPFELAPTSAFGELKPRSPDNTDPGPRSWLGSLIGGSRDASGLLYRRNRYLDPKSGRFTQEDPIGLAGGLNLYGFANGDPVSYSDPYGLCAQGDTTPAQVTGQCTPDSRLPPRQTTGGVKDVSLDIALNIAPLPTKGPLATIFGRIATSIGGLFGRRAAPQAVKIAQAALREGGNPLAQIQRAGQMVGSLGLSQDGAMNLLKASIEKMGYEHGGDVSIGGALYLMSQVTSRGGTIRALRVAQDGSVTNAVLREVQGGFEVVR